MESLFSGDKTHAPCYSELDNMLKLLSCKNRSSNESDFVDEQILNVDKAYESNVLKTKCTSSTQAFLENPRNRTGVEAVKENERVKVAEKMFQWIPIREEVLRKYQKDCDTSCKLRDRGNNMFRQGNYQLALDSYNLTIMFAPTDSKDLGLGFANRSAVLLGIGDPEGALKDIELALTHNYPKESVEKLEQRKAKARGLIDQKYQKYGEAIRREVNSRMEIRKKMLRMEKPNPLMPAAAEFVQLKFDEVKGRHLIVKEDVAPGTVLVVEDPYMTVLYGQTNWETRHCHHCLKRIHRGIPCGDCVFAMYCNEACRDKAAVVHQYECKCLSYFHVNSTSHDVQMAFRIICKVGPAEIFRLFSTKDPAYFEPKVPFGTEENFKYDSAAYLPLYHLQDHGDKRDLVDRLNGAHEAVLASIVLDFQTDFFKDIALESKAELKNFVAALILRHYESFRVNGAAVQEVEGIEKFTLADTRDGVVAQKELIETIRKMNYSDFAAGVYPVFSMSNHSCDGNAFRLNDLENGTIVVIAARQLKKEEPIFVPYTVNFTSCSPTMRQSHLSSVYFFNCKCIACENKWSGLGSALQYTFCCPSCSKKFFEFDKTSRTFRKCVLNGQEKLKCGLCGHSYKRSHLEAMMNVKMTEAGDAQRLLETNKPRKAVARFLKLNEFFQYHLSPPYGQQYCNQDLLRNAYALIFYFSQ